MECTSEFDDKDYREMSSFNFLSYLCFHKILGSCIVQAHYTRFMIQHKMIAHLFPLLLLLGGLKCQEDIKV